MAEMLVGRAAPAAVLVLKATRSPAAKKLVVSVTLAPFAVKLPPQI